MWMKRWEGSNFVCDICCIFQYSLKRKCLCVQLMMKFFPPRIPPPRLPSQFFAFCLLYFSRFKCLILHNRHFASWLTSIRRVNLNIAYLTADSSRLCFFCAAGRIPPPRSLLAHSSFYNIGKEQKLFCIITCEFPNNLLKNFVHHYLKRAE